jgi:hypothetical protein
MSPNPALLLPRLLCCTNRPVGCCGGSCCGWRRCDDLQEVALTEVCKLGSGRLASGTRRPRADQLAIPFVEFITSVVFCCFALVAHAASTNLSIIINSPPSTGLNCTINYPAGATAFMTPVPASTTIVSCSVAPAGWSGALALSGPDASFFSLAGLTLQVGSAAITTPRTYSVILTATP